MEKARATIRENEEQTCFVVGDTGFVAGVSTLLRAGEKLDPFTISYASVSGTRGPLWIARDLGLFAKYGLDVDLVYIASGVTSVNALLGGSVDIIAASGSSVVSAAARARL